LVVTAELLGDGRCGMSAEQVPDWVVPEGGIMAADLDHIPGLPPHTEMIDGGLYFMSPQRVFHMLVTQVLYAALGVARPSDLRVRMQMTVTLGPRDRPEPDLLVLSAAAETGVDQTSYPVEAVLLAVEVVSPESQKRDRKIKPVLYAEAGIPHFWRVEENDGQPVVYVYELDQATSSYALTGIHHDRLKLTVPYDIDADLSALADL
jgi:Uma2 family endonuclease